MVAARSAGGVGFDAGSAANLSLDPYTAPPCTPPPASTLVNNFPQ